MTVGSETGAVGTWSSLLPDSAYGAGVRKSIWLQDRRLQSKGLRQPHWGGGGRCPFSAYLRNPVTSFLEYQIFQSPLDFFH